MSKPPKNSFTYKGHTIVLKESLFGISYWAQHYVTIPRFEVFYYLGEEKGTGLHFFQSKSEGTIISKTIDELYRGVATDKHSLFKPLLLNMDKIYWP